MMPSLAPELVLQILEAVYQPSSSCLHPDTSTLSSAALVCTSWAPLAQQVLFRDVVLLRTPDRTPVARAAPGVLLASSTPPHALRDAKPDVTPRVSRAARLSALAAAAPCVPAPRSHRSSQAFVQALEIDRSPSLRAQSLASLVRSIHVLVSPPDPCGCVSHFGGICPKPCSAASPLPTGALTERHLAVLFRRLPSLARVHVVLDRIDSFSPAVTDALRASSNVSTLSVHVLKRPYSSMPLFNANNAIRSHLGVHYTPIPVQADEHAAVFQLIRALAPNLDTLVLDGELPRDPPTAEETPLHVSGLRATLKDDDTLVFEPAPDCALRALVWRGRLPPSPALLTWLLSVKAQGRAELPLSRRKPSRLEVLELCYLPPPDALADLLREHVPTLRSLRLHYFEPGHVDVVRDLITPNLSELVLNKRCTAAANLLLCVHAQHVAVAQPCADTMRALESAGRRGFKRVTVVDGEKSASEQVKAACEAEGVLFENVNVLGRSLVF
ncbi:hypothetical protein FRC10_009012 [Ceratobasidium sp. 414]|nr:hypothetical protein FRC10_009012 [Ceratobasidium sp. 414]